MQTCLSRRLRTAWSWSFGSSNSWEASTTGSPARLHLSAPRRSSFAWRRRTRTSTSESFDIRERQQGQEDQVRGHRRVSAYDAACPAVVWTCIIERVGGKMMRLELSGRRPSGRSKVRFVDMKLVGVRSRKSDSCCQNAQKSDISFFFT